MMRKTSWALCIVSLLLIISSCSNKPDNVAISSDGTNIYFDHKGQGEPAIVFVHGFSVTRKYWNYQLEYFSNKYKTVTIDLGGFGESVTTRTNWTISAMGEDVVAVIKKLKLNRVVLIGHSMGGPVIVEAAKRMPEKIVGLVPVDIFQNIDDVWTKETIDGTISYIKTAWKNPDSWNFLKDKTIIQHYADQLPEEQPNYWWPVLAETFEWINESKEKFSQIDIPIFSINSDEKPTNVELFKEYVPSFSTKIIPNTGHFLSWEEPDKFNQALEDVINEFQSINIEK